MGVDNVPTTALGLGFTPVPHLLLFILHAFTWMRQEEERERGKEKIPRRALAASNNNAGAGEA